MVESFANTSNENAARQVDGEIAVTKGDQKHDSRSLENIFGLPGNIEESSSTTQAGYELTRNNWDLVAQADMLTSGKFSNYGLDRWDLNELASNPCYPLDSEQRERERVSSI
ncbi:MAG: hypothetical protein IAF58_17225 [Leptolyngbya sp.]|nr:hypothetical protein [Candidatus Melainabacteria bacterium]